MDHKVLSLALWNGQVFRKFLGGNWSEDSTPFRQNDTVQHSENTKFTVNQQTKKEKRTSKMCRNRPFWHKLGNCGDQIVVYSTETVVGGRKKVATTSRTLCIAHISTSFQKQSLNNRPLDAQSLLIVELAASPTYTDEKLHVESWNLLRPASTLQWAKQTCELSADESISFPGSLQTAKNIGLPERLIKREFAVTCAHPVPWSYVRIKSLKHPWWALRTRVIFTDPKFPVKAFTERGEIPKRITTGSSAFNGLRWIVCYCRGWTQ